MSQTINNLYFSSKSCSKLNNIFLGFQPSPHFPGHHFPGHIKPSSGHQISPIPTIPTFSCRLHRGTSLLCEELKSERPLSFPHAAKSGCLGDINKYGIYNFSLYNIMKTRDIYIIWYIYNLSHESLYNIMLRPLILYGIHGINGYHCIFSWIWYLWIDILPYMGFNNKYMIYGIP